MKSEIVKSLLKEHGETASLRQAECPPDDQFAVFVDGGLDEKDHARLCAHIADCNFCVERLGILGRAREAEEQEPVSQILVARAARRTAVAGPGRPAVGRWATAAVLVLAVALVLVIAPERATSPAPNLKDRPRITRSIDMPATSSDRGISILSRKDVFQWAAVPDSLFYEVRIVTDEGDLIWKERARAANWELPLELALEHGREYFVRVDAYLSESESIRSDYVPFRLDEVR